MLASHCSHFIAVIVFIIFQKLYCYVSTLISSQVSFPLPKLYILFFFFLFFFFLLDPVLPLENVQNNVNINGRWNFFFFFLHWPQLSQRQNNLHIHVHFDVPRVSEAHCKQTCIPDVECSMFVLNTLETFFLFPRFSLVKITCNTGKVREKCQLFVLQVLDRQAGTPWRLF